MFNTGSQQTVMKSGVESADSGLESANYSADSNANPAKVGACVRALSQTLLTACADNPQPYPTRNTSRGQGEAFNRKPVICRWRR